MTANDPQTNPDDDALKKRLLNRIAVAGVVIVGLLAGLAVFDAMNRPEAPAPVAQAPAPAEQKAEEAKPPATPPEEAKPAEAPPPAEEKKAEVPAEPERTAPAAAPAFAGPAPEKSLTKPATPRPAMHKPTVQPAPAKPEPAREIARTEEAARHAPPARPLEKAVEAARRYLVQLGVFNNVANAEDLRAKLTLNGIPSQIEARVQVGPFATREEAEAARQKLISLGMEPGIILAVKK